jgi:hypothetical protein
LAFLPRAIWTLFLQGGDETTMALKTMPIAKLQDLKSKIEAAINAKVSERRRELETELAKLAQFGGRGGKAIRSETVLRVGDLRMDLVSRTVTRCGRDIELLPREFQVLEYLVCNQSQIVPRAMLLQHVWDSISTPRPTSSMSMSGASAARSTTSKRIRSFIRFAASGFAFVLLAKAGPDWDCQRGSMRWRPVAPISHNRPILIRRTDARRYSKGKDRADN